MAADLRVEFQAFFQAETLLLDGLQYVLGVSPAADVLQAPKLPLFHSLRVHHDLRLFSRPDILGAAQALFGKPLRGIDFHPHFFPAGLLYLPVSPADEHHQKDSGTASLDHLQRHRPVFASLRHPVPAAGRRPNNFARRSQEDRNQFGGRHLGLRDQSEGLNEANALRDDRGLEYRVIN